MKQNPTLPNDIKHYVKISIIKRIAICCSLFAFLGTLIFFFGDLLFPNESENIKTSFFLFIMLLPFVISGVPHKLLGSTWHGKIINVDVKTVYASYMVGIRPWPYEKNIITLTIEKENGKTVFKEVKSLGIENPAKKNRYVSGKIEQCTDDYKIGDTIYYFYGLPYPIITENSQEHRFCAVCGHKNPNGNDKCFNCGYTIIK